MVVAIISLLSFISYPIFNFWALIYDDCSAIESSVVLSSSYYSSLHICSSFLDGNLFMNLTESFISVNLSMNQALLDRTELFLYSLFSFYLLFSSILVPSLTLILANLVDTYLLGILAVFLVFIRYFYILGSLTLSYLFYIFISKLELYLLLLFFVELFSVSFQSLTLTNRLSINLIAGSLIMNLLSKVLVIVNPCSWSSTLFFLIFYTLIFIFELFQIFLQLFIFCLLHYSFLGYQ